MSIQTTKNIILRTVLFYAFAAGLWIFISDHVLSMFVTDPALITSLQSYKGIFFIIVTAALLYVLLQKGFFILEKEHKDRIHAETSSVEQEIRLADIITTAKDAIISIDSKLCIVLFNPAAEIMFDRTSAEMIGKTIDELSPIRFREEYRDNILRLTSTEDMSRTSESLGMIWGLNSNGREFPIEASLSKSCVNGNTWFTVILRDNTERLRSDEELREKENRYRSLFENMLNGFAYCKMLFENGEPKDFIYLSVNSAFKKLTGLENVVGRKATEVIPGIIESSPTLIRRYGRVSLTGVPEQFEFYLSLVDMWFSVSVYSPKAEHIVVVFDVITERKRAEQQLQESERRFREMLENFDLIAMMLDTKGTVTFCNDYLLNLTGYVRNEIINTDWFSTFIPESDKEVKKIFFENITSGTIPSHHQNPIKTKEGQLRDIFWNNSTLRDSSGNIIGTASIGEDITDRKTSEETHVLLMTALESVVNGVVITDRHGIIIWVNKGFTTITGFEAQEVVGKNPRLLKSGKQEEGMYKNLWKTISSGNIWNGELVNRKKDGTHYSEEMTITPIIDYDRNITHFVAIKQDISARKTLEESEKHLAGQLQQSQKLESLGTLASGIAHDFNNILGIMIVHAALIERIPGDKESIKKSTDAITKAGMRGAALVKQMLTFARKTDVKITSLSLNEVVTEVTKLLNETFPKTVTLSLQLENALPLISADATQIHQVLLNLCVNARDAMNNNGTLTINTFLQRGDTLRLSNVKAIEDNYIVLNVSDTGAGMSEETQQRIFEPFFTTKELGKGTGLGLSLVFGIMETHKGFVEVQSAIGEGTTFRCYFPVPVTTELQDVEKRKKTTAVPGGNETVLFVEDEEMLRTFVSSLLASKGYTVLTAGTGEEGEKMYREHQRKIDLVISDLGLPKFSGDELFRRIKLLNPEVRMILASGYIEPGLKDRLFVEGVKEIIQKPYELDEILNAVREVLDKS